MIEKKKPNLNLQRGLIGFAAMGVVIVLFAALVRLTPGKPPPDDILAILAAFMLLQMGVVMAIVHIARPADAPQRGQPLSQVLNFLIGALTFLIPIFGPVWFSPELLYGIFLVLFVISQVTLFRIWRGADELMRRMLSDASVVGFQVLMSGVCLYAVAERLGLVQGFTMWALLGVASVVNIGASFYVIRRHGQHKYPPEE